MKTLLRTVSIMAILNLLAILGFVGWMASKGRLEKQRILEATAIFTETPQERTAREDAERKAIEAANAPPPVPEGDIQTTDRRNEARVEVTAVDRERLERLQREVRDLQAQLRQQRQMLDNERQQFEQDKANFQAMRQRLSEIEGADAFQKALEVLTGMKPSDIRPVLTTLMDEGKNDEVVAYLAAFDDRLRAKVVTEFVKNGETQVAAGLLESLRTRGLEPADPGVSSP